MNSRIAGIGLIVFISAVGCIGQSTQTPRGTTSARALQLDPKLVPESLLVKQKDAAMVEDSLQKDPGVWVVARAVNAASGAVICSNMNDVSTVFRLLNESREEQLQNQVTHGMSSIANGSPMATPRLLDYGCVLVKRGSFLQMRKLNGTPLVTARLSNGRRIVGVTMNSMLSPENP